MYLEVLPDVELLRIVASGLPTEELVPVAMRNLTDDDLKAVAGGRKLSEPPHGDGEVEAA